MNFFKDRFDSDPGLVVEQFRKGDERAFAWIHKFFWRQLIFFAKKLIQDEDEAKDIVSDNFVKLWKKKEDFAELSSIKAFLYISVRNTCFDFIRKEERLELRKKDFLYLYDDTEQDVLGLMLRTELLYEISKEIKKLNGKPRKICELILNEGLNSDEIAKRLNMHIKTVRNLRAIAANQIQTVFLKKKLLFFALMVWLFR